MWNSTRTPSFQAASGFFEHREVPAFFFQNFRTFLLFKTPDPPGKESRAKTPTPRAVRMCELGLELTDT